MPQLVLRRSSPVIFANYSLVENQKVSSTAAVLSTDHLLFVVGDKVCIRNFCMKYTTSIPFERGQDCKRLFLSWANDGYAIQTGRWFKCLRGVRVVGTSSRVPCAWSHRSSWDVAGAQVSALGLLSAGHTGEMSHVHLSSQRWDIKHTPNEPLCNLAEIIIC